MQGRTKKEFWAWEIWAWEAQTALTDDGERAKGGGEGERREGGRERGREKREGEGEKERERRNPEDRGREATQRRESESQKGKRKRGERKREDRERTLPFLPKGVSLSRRFVNRDAKWKNLRAACSAFSSNFAFPPTQMMEKKHEKIQRDIAKIILAFNF